MEQNDGSAGGVVKVHFANRQADCIDFGHQRVRMDVPDVLQEEVRHHPRELLAG